MQFKFQRNDLVIHYVEQYHGVTHYFVVLERLTFDEMRSHVLVVDMINWKIFTDVACRYKLIQRIN